MLQSDDALTRSYQCSDIVRRGVARLGRTAARPLFGLRLRRRGRGGRGHGCDDLGRRGAVRRDAQSMSGRWRRVAVFRRALGTTRLYVVVLEPRDRRVFGVAARQRIVRVRRTTRSRSATAARSDGADAPAECMSGREHAADLRAGGVDEPRLRRRVHRRWAREPRVLRVASRGDVRVRARRYPMLFRCRCTLRWRRGSRGVRRRDVDAHSLSVMRRAPRRGVSAAGGCHIIMRVRRMSGSARLLLALSLSATACPSSDGRTAPTCEGMESTCVDGETLRTCREESFVEVSCETLCAEQSANARPDGCIRTTEGPDACKCDEATVGTNPCLQQPRPAARCDRDDGVRTLRHCAGETWTETPCAELCAQTHDVGCFFDPVLVEDACLCASEGDACTLAGYPSCVEGGLLSCEGYTWQLMACPPCDDGPSCRTDSFGVGSCACAPG